MSAVSWRIELLGGLSVSRGDLRVTHFRTRKAASLLAYLILHPKRHRRETLTDAFWPNVNFDSARNSFRVSLSHIRKALGEDFLEMGQETVAITLPLVCDVVEFEQAVRAKRWNDAARLYEGPLLPGFWDDWIVEKRELLEALYETVREHVTDATMNIPATLPPEPNRFFGREDEIERMGALLTENRLVTFLGPGGIGKTRLSIAAARRHAALFPGGVWFVPLAEVTAREGILPTIRDGLNIPRSPSGEPLAQIVDYLTGESPCLLILDNFEQIAAQGAPIVPALLSRLPNLTCLVTSRRRLGVPGERQKTISPLAEVPGVALFCDRASIAPSEDILPLCRDLEGVPLAIELCAARLGEFTVAEMRDKLAERFTLLAASATNRPVRHRSLFAAIDWSYRLLTPEQRRFFERLSVFRGGWTREAAESVCDEPNAAEYLAQLRERSLIVSEESQGVIRFRALESLREFAEERLTKGERSELEARHAAFFLSFAQKCDTEVANGGDNHWLDLMETDHENLRRVPNSVDLASAMWRFWNVRGHHSEGRERLIAALALRANRQTSVSRTARANALLGAGVLAYAQGDFPAAGKYGKESLALYQEIADRQGIAEALVNLGIVFMAETDYAAAHDRIEESLALYRKIGDHHGVANALWISGQIFQEQGDLRAARTLFAECLTLYREIGDRPGIGNALSALGGILQDEGDYDAARTLYAESLALCREMNDTRRIAIALGDLGHVLVETGDDAAGRAFLEESLTIRRKIGDKRGVANMLDNLGFTFRVNGDYPSARLTLEESLAIHRQIGDKRGVAVSLASFAALCAAQGKTTVAALLWGKAEETRTSLGAPLSPNVRAAQTQQVSEARAASDAPTFAAAWQEGRALTLEQAIKLALGD